MKRQKLKRQLMMLLNGLNKTPMLMLKNTNPNKRNLKLFSILLSPKFIKACHKREVCQGVWEVCPEECLVDSPVASQDKVDQLEENQEKDQLLMMLTEEPTKELCDNICNYI